MKSRIKKSSLSCRNSSMFYLVNDGEMMIRRRYTGRASLAKFRLVLLHAAILLLISLPLVSQNWEVYSTANSELPNNTVRALAIDENGVKWIGTAGGVARFDGTNWTLYTTSTSGLPSNNVRCIEISSTGYIWMGTDSGLAVYDGFSQGQNPDQSWQGWTVYNMNNSGLPRNVVSSLTIDSFNSVWIGTLGGGGLARFSGGNWTIFNTGNSDLPNNFVYAVATGANNLIWVGTNYGLASYDGSVWAVYYSNTSPLPDNAVRTLFAGSSQNIYIGTADGGMAIFNNDAWTVYTQVNSPLPENEIPAVSAKENGTIWVGTGSTGILRKNNSVWSLYNTANSGLPNNSINSLIIEDNHLKWIGTNGGLVSYDIVSVTGIEVIPDNVVLLSGESYQLSATISPHNATNQNINWYSENSNLASVDQEGLVTANSTGTVYIFAATEDGNYIDHSLITITGTVGQPVLAPPAGAYEDGVVVSMTSPTEGAVIRYTLDGSEPTEESLIYQEPLEITVSTTVSARAFKEHWLPSEVTVAHYEIYTSIGSEDGTAIELLRCEVFPNPITLSSAGRGFPAASFRLYQPSSGAAALSIYDIKGRKIRIFEMSDLQSGEHVRSLDLKDQNGKRLPAGIYLYRYSSDGESVTGKFAIIR